jgi:putative hemolysin
MAAEGITSSSNSVVTPEKPATLEIPIAARACPTSFAREINGLPVEQVLYSSGPYQVIWALQAQAPAVVQEIGRLREVNFRAVGEGTGQAIDLDRYDGWYVHLFVWERDEQRVLGAYRLGKTDVILAEQGRSGLYTDTLFHFSDDFLRFMCPALEMGRSFVDQEYQRHSRVLALLWRGIGQIVALEPKYHRLFGPVSVSALYNEESRSLIATQLMNGPFRHEWSDYVLPMRSVTTLLCGRATAGVEPEADGLESVQSLNARVAQLEPDGKGLPTLVKEYIKLGGRFLAFSVDPDFGNALDGLVTVDLLATEPRLLNLFMGPEAHLTFKRAHGIEVVLNKRTEGRIHEKTSVL